MSETPASAELLRLERARLQHANVHLERSNLELREALREEHDTDLQLAVAVRCPPPPPLPSSLLGRARANPANHFTSHTRLVLLCGDL